MFTAIFSFFGSQVFRMIWGEVSSWLTARQDHRHEMQRREFEAQEADKQHQRNLASIQLQADLGEKQILLQAQAAVDEVEARAWLEGVKATALVTGVKWIDGWNAAIRPFVATWSVVMVFGNYLAWWKLDDQGWALVGAALGLYLAERQLFKRGK